MTESATSKAGYELLEAIAEIESSVDHDDIDRLTGVAAGLIGRKACIIYRLENGSELTPSEIAYIKTNLA